MDHDTRSCAVTAKTASHSSPSQAPSAVAAAGIVEESEYTPMPVVEAIVHVIGPRPGDLCYDLGCGDGRLVIAMGATGACSVGIELDAGRASLARDRCKASGVKNLAIRTGDLRTVGDVESATIVVIWQFDELLRAGLARCTNAHTIVSIEHEIKGARPYVKDGVRFWVWRKH